MVSAISCFQTGHHLDYPTAKTSFGILTSRPTAVLLNSGKCDKKLKRRKIRVKGLGGDKGEWDDWRRFQLSSLVLCIHVPFDRGSVPFLAAATGHLVADLEYSQIAGMRLVMTGCELYILHRVIESFSRRYLHGNRLFHFEISLASTIEGIMMAVVALGLSLGISTVMPVVDASPGMMILKEGDGRVRMAEGLDVVAVTPILEEVVYRGVLLSCLSMSLTIPWSLFSSATMFALLHFSMDAISVHWVSGVVFGMGYLRTARNLWTPILAHGLYNTIATVLLLWT